MRVDSHEEIPVVGEQRLWHSLSEGHRGFFGKREDMVRHRCLWLLERFEADAASVNAQTAESGQYLRRFDFDCFLLASLYHDLVDGIIGIIGNFRLAFITTKLVIGNMFHFDQDFVAQLIRRRKASRFDLGCCEEMPAPDLLHDLDHGVLL